MDHYFDSNCDCPKCNKDFVKEDFDTYSLTLHKTCKKCNTYFLADKPWYYNCKNCYEIVKNDSFPQCFYCKEIYYENVIIYSEFLRSRLALTTNLLA